MNRRDFLKVSATGLGTLFVSGIGLNILRNHKPAVETVTEATPIQILLNSES